MNISNFEAFRLQALTEGYDEALEREWAPLTLLDMPFAALDAPSRGVVRELLAEAAQHAHRAWVVADYEAPAGVPLSGRLSLPA